MASGEREPLWREGHTFFLVEEGQANQGELSLALEMVQLAAGAGADGIEFQFAIADDFYVAGHPQHATYTRRQLAPEAIQEIAATAHAAGLAVTAASLSERLPEALAAAGYDALTVNSSDVTNPRVLDAVAETLLPVLLGTAMADLDEIDWAVDRLTKRRCGPLCVLHGQHVSASAGQRGVPPHEVSLRTIGLLSKRYGLPVGFIDHTSFRETPALAAAHGAVLVTKHMAPRTGWEGPDASICLVPDEVKEAVRLVRLADAAAGVESKRLAPGETADRALMRRSIVAARQLAAGTVLTDEHLALKRPGGGLDGRQLEALVGATVRRSLERDHPLTEEDVDRPRA